MTSYAYATRAEMYSMGIAQAALTGMSTDSQDMALEAASRMVDSYVRPRAGVPFPNPAPYEIKRATCVIAAWDLITSRGYSPQGVDQAVQNRYESTILWLRDVATGKAQLDYENDATPSTVEHAPLIACDDGVDWDA
jgi:phage gp36-like protein